MKTKNDGGPAFARAGYINSSTGEGDDGHPGMTLRDYFAARIAAGDAAASSADSDGWSSHVSSEVINERVALYYRIADEMLRQSRS